eukprot:SAG25_NODE_2021_length_2018_cov_2.743505_3_plen_63_part_00
MFSGMLMDSTGYWTQDSGDTAGDAGGEQGDATRELTPEEELERAIAMSIEEAEEADAGPESQ